MTAETLYEISEWFYFKTDAEQQYCGIRREFTSSQIVKESEKAMQVLFKYAIWVPKSQVTVTGEREVEHRTEVRGIEAGLRGGFCIYSSGLSYRDSWGHWQKGTRTTSYMELDKAKKRCQDLHNRGLFFRAIRRNVKTGEILISFDSYKKDTEEYTTDKMRDWTFKERLCERREVSDDEQREDKIEETVDNEKEVLLGVISRRW